MAVSIPSNARISSLHAPLTQGGLVRVHQGKVRDSYSLSDHHDLLLVVSTDRISIFDFVLPATIPLKGEVLTAMTVFWLRHLTSLHNHLVAYGPEMARYLPEGLRRRKDLRRQGLIVKRLRMLPIECIVRGYLTGSGWKSYQETGEVCGIRLPAGLTDGSRLPKPIFTPTTKAQTGHDEHLPAGEVERRYGSFLREKSLTCYREMSKIAEERGLILADTKLEFSEDGILADEVGTPDSSRYWDRQDWEKSIALGRSPASLDKQAVRDWGKTADTEINRPICGHSIRLCDKDCDPDNSDHVRAVSNMTIPELVKNETTKRYLSVFRRLLEGMDLASFQRHELSA